MRSLRVSVVQLRSTEDEGANLTRIEELVRRAANDGAEVVFLPENATWLRIGDEPNPGHVVGESATLAALAAMARHHSLSLAVGSTLVAGGPGELPTNTSLVYSPDGELRARYDKIHLFAVDLDADTSFDERRHIRAGGTPVTCDIAGTRVGLTICYDLRFPALYQALRAAGAEVLAVPSAFTLATGRDHWEVLLRARAIENQCFVVAAAQWGHHGGRRTSFGRSLVIDPWGTIMACIPDGEGLATVDLDLSRVAEVRRRLPCGDHTVPLSRVVQAGTAIP
jgi:predicted amidohydrolase